MDNFTFITNYFSSSSYYGCIVTLNGFQAMALIEIDFSFILLIGCKRMDDGFTVGNIRRIDIHIKLTKN